MIDEPKHLLVGNAPKIGARDRGDLVARKQTAELWGDVLVEQNAPQAA